ncbi:hypothetical protein Egran_04879 [Elaphomyces granulatus]|uniref:GDP/GTP exchange factor Sec2 N-terminal domain-containing protein n=1 Tax=Elaphomyces granulatus TaxID=519963 RepID=A0A232LTA8_9EURO|nr:hypothetical protein Egran_04879 [Elaphomyces granulatus]
MSATTITTTTTTNPLVGVGMGTACRHCGLVSSHDGVGVATEARRRIHELEAQVQFLSSRAAQTGRSCCLPSVMWMMWMLTLYLSTAEKLADYEDEIRLLRSKAQEVSENKKDSISSSISLRSSGPTPTAVDASSPPDSSSLESSLPPHSHTVTAQAAQGARLASLASLLPYRRSTPSPAIHPPSAASPVPHPPSDATSELQTALSREQALRKAAESQLLQANSELEELTVQLFSQANEMVAQERKARAKLEERVAVLERRDGEKRKRLDRLEKAVERVERVRGMIR